MTSALSVYQPRAPTQGVLYQVVRDHFETFRAQAAGHVHALVIDGVVASDGAGMRFHPAPPLTTADVADVLATVEPRVRRRLDRRGVGDRDESGGAADAWADVRRC